MHQVGGVGVTRCVCVCVCVCGGGGGGGQAMGVRIVGELDESGPK